MTEKNNIPAADIDVLRKLAHELAKIAALPIQKEKAELWRKVNQLQSVRPVVWIEEVPWHEFKNEPELKNLTTHQWSVWQETLLRRKLYQWKHFPADMVISDYLEIDLVYSDSGFGIEVEEDIVRTDNDSSIVSHRYHKQIQNPEDIEKIKDPVIKFDPQATEEHYQLMNKVYGGIMPIKKSGRRLLWFTPWDCLVQWWGVEQALMDLVMRPDMVNAVVSRFVDASLIQLEQLEKLNLLTLNNDNIRGGSGGYCYTNELPAKGYNEKHVRTIDMWGCSNAQIFSQVSPEMHWEFALRHEIRWLEKWGMNYYGCCEPLDFKMDILRKIPNLRKISMSPWVNVERAVKQLEDKYVYSHKPSPAIMAQGNFDIDRIKKDTKEFLEKAKNCHVEIILKDISTVGYDPKRLKQWNDCVMGLLE